MQSYTIQSGDTLSSIASRNKTSIPELLKLNPNITNPNVIQTGGTINLSAQPFIGPVQPPMYGPTKPVNPTIGAKQLNTQVTPINIVNAKPETQLASLQGTMTEMANQNANQYMTNEQLQAKRDEASKSLTTLVDTALGRTGKAETRANEYATTGVDTLNSELKDINNKIIQEQVANRRQIEELQRNNPQGLFGGALNAEINRLNRESLSKQADLAVIQMAKQGQYDSAKEIADRAIAVKLEKQGNELEVRKLQYQELKDQLTKDEQRQFESITKQKDREYEQKKADLKSISDLSINALENGAPPSLVVKMRASTTVEEAIRIGGSYINKSDRAYKDAHTKNLLAGSSWVNDTEIVQSPYVNAMVNVNAGSAEGQQKRDAARIAQFVKNGQTQEAKNLILSRVASKMSTTEREGEVDRRNTIDALNDMKQAFNDYVAETGDTNVIKGGIENLANKIGTTTNPKLAAIKTRIIQATQKYRNAITGAAWGEQEDAEYRSIFPSISNTNKLNQTIIDTMIPLLQNNERNTIGFLLGGSDVYDEIFGNGTMTGTTAQPTQISTVKEGDTKNWKGVIYKVINGVWTPQ